MSDKHTQGLAIHGFACPIGKWNTYNELMLPHAFDRFLSEWRKAGKPSMPMKWMHGQIVGWWDDLRQTAKGLYCTGMISPLFVPLYQTGNFPELSISFSEFGLPNAQRPVTHTTYKRFATTMHLPSNANIAERQEYPNVFVHEISIVDRGAFPGTWTRKT